MVGLLPLPPLPHFRRGLSEAGVELLGKVVRVVEPALIRNLCDSSLRVPQQVRGVVPAERVDVLGQSVPLTCPFIRASNI